MVGLGHLLTGSCYFAWADLVVVGLACDIAGALMLAFSFMAKSAASIRREVPKAVSAIEFGGGFSSAAFPQGLAESMCRQKAEAWLGAPVLMAGFALQGIAFFAPSSRLETVAQKLVAMGLAIATWLFCLVLWKTTVPLLTRRMLGTLDQ